MCVCVEGGEGGVGNGVGSVVPCFEHLTHGHQMEFVSPLATDDL